MQKRIPLHIQPDHPAFAGHFPGTPIVPGVVLLDEILHALSVDTGLVATDWLISSVKFMSPLNPGESAMIQYEHTNNGGIKFELLHEGMQGNRQVVIGNLALKLKTSEA
jgi:3-hydroxymyristoyl/3-hydroxydecanoyl-(acyl carrier protein) dehydratase